MDALETLLSTPTCEELAIRGQSRTAPRRLFFSELDFALRQVDKQTMAQLELYMMDIQPQQLHGAVRPLEWPKKLRKSLASLQQLDTVLLQDCRLDSSLLQHVLQALHALPHLTRVQLHLMDLTPAQQEMISRQAFQWLQKPVLQSLALNFFPNNWYVWQTLETSTTLRNLQCHVPAAAVLPAQRVLQYNTCLQHLTIHVAPGTPLQPLAEGLRHNTALQSFTLYLQTTADSDSDNNDGDTDNNHDNREDNNRVAQDAVELFQSVLEYDNLTLHRFQLYRGQERVTTTLLDFYGHLNQHVGRQRLFQHCYNSNKRKKKNAIIVNEYMTKLYRHQYDTSVIYYLLHHQLELFASAVQ
jgi:hypothetical protein